MERKVNQTKLIELYNKGLNDTEIADILQVNHVSIKNNRELLNLASNFKYKRRFDVKEFIKLYEKGLNDIKISEILKVSKSAIQNYRKKLGLESNHNVYKEVELSFEQEQIIIGGLLGDSHFNKKYKNASGEFVHCLKQKEYCIWKKEFIKEFCSSIRYGQQFDKRTKKVYYKIICSILSNPVFNPYYDLFYKNKIKIIPKELLYRLEGLGLAIWYMDDGSKTKKSYTIATNSFSDTDMDIIQEFFLTKFNIKTSLYSNNVLYIKQESANTFKLLINPYIIDSMRYKLHQCPL